MDKKVIIQQKEEIEKLININYIQRESLTEAKQLLNTDLIKIITGPRRAGKSVFCMQLLKGEKFAYLNFDDENLLKIKDTDRIIELIYEVYPEHKFIFFDEIQNFPDWELFINKLHRRGKNIVLTGSNASFLAKDMAKTLTGRYLIKNILPFSFKEFLKAKKFEYSNKENITPETKGKLISYFESYIQSGGFPEVVVKDLEHDLYLKTLFDAIIYKDVVKRYKIRNAQQIDDISLFIISNYAKEISYKKIKNLTGLRSTSTVIKYIKYLEDTYLFNVLNRFSNKLKIQIKAPKKIYITDNGFIKSSSFKITNDLGRIIENIYFIEMLRKGFEKNRTVFYYSTAKGQEIDFLLREGINIKELIQICYDIDSYDVFEREVKALINGAEELDCDNLKIITWDKDGEEKYKRHKIKIVSLWRELI